jgi:hypothetical protein
MVEVWETNVVLNINRGETGSVRPSVSLERRSFTIPIYKNSDVRRMVMLLMKNQNAPRHRQCRPRQRPIS